MSEEPRALGSGWVSGTASVVDVGVRSVLAVRAEGDSGVMLALTNLGDEACAVNAPSKPVAPRPANRNARRPFLTSLMSPSDSFALASI